MIVDVTPNSEQRKSFKLTHGSQFMKIQLEHQEPTDQANIDELSRVLLSRFGLQPRKKDGSAQLHALLIELSERKKASNREKKPELSVIPVEEMAFLAGIKRQTMYEYLHRWLDLNVLKKTSFVSNGKVVIGYELNGPNLEASFRKAESTIKTHLDMSFKILDNLQNEIKKDKLRQNKADEPVSEAPKV